MTTEARRALEETGLVIRAEEILAESLEDATKGQYLEALVQARNERAGVAYADAIAKRAGVETEPEHKIADEAIHTAAESYLRAQGKGDDYTADEYIAAVNLVKSTTGTE
jgi:hypothetical protein